MVGSYANGAGAGGGGKNGAAEGKLDELRRRYGSAAVQRGRLFARGSAEREATQGSAPIVPARGRED